MEAMANMGETGQAIPQLEDIKTTDIESEEVDIFERKKNFEHLLAKFEKHKQENASLRGNDLRYNIYMKKLNKLTRMDLGLDVEAYKDYINNLKKFSHLNNDFEIYARDQLNFDDFSFRQLIEVEIEKNPKLGDLGTIEDGIRFELECQTILNTLRKLKRNYRGFLAKKDNTILKEYLDNMRKYMLNFDIYAITRQLYEKRQRELKDRQTKD